MLIDAHVHAFPDRLAGAVRNQLNFSGQLTAGHLLEDVARQVRDEGFDGAWILPYAHRAGVSESVNSWSAAEVGKHPGLVAGATFHPEDGDFARLVYLALRISRLRVVKLHCSVGKFSPKDRRLNPLWEIASDLGVPIVIHAGQIGGGVTEADEVAEVEAVLSAHPMLKVVLAHTGNPNHETALALMERYPNLYGDLTPVWETPVGLRAENLERFPGRFLFGSDAPNNPVAAKAQLERWREIVPAGEAAAVFGGAAAALIPPR